MQSCRRVTCIGTAALSLVSFFLCGWLAVAAVLVGGSTPTIVQNDGRTSTAGLGGRLVLEDAEPTTIDPALAMDSLSAKYIAEIFSGLVTLNRNLEVVPDIAESWKISDDGTVYTFYLRPGVKFHNGREVTAGDFKASMERASDPATESMVADTYLGDIVGARDMMEGRESTISGIRALNDRTLEITITSPRAYFLSKLTYPTAFVVDIENTSTGPDWITRPNGTGPFSIKEWQSGDRLVLTRNGYYYGNASKLDEVTFLFHAGSPLALYEAGEIDVAGVGASDIDLVNDKSSPLSKELVTVPELSVAYVAFNTQKPPFDDAKVRQAFAHAVDKNKLASVALKNTVEESEGILPPGLPGHNEDIKGLTFDPELARKLIYESKYRAPELLPAAVLNTGPRAGTDARLTLALVDMWKKNLGVDVQIQQTDSDAFYRDLYRRSYQMYVTGWIADYPDPQNFLQLLFHSRSVENRGSYSNPEVDRLLDKAESERLLDARLRIYQEVEKTVVQDAPWIPLYFGKSYYVVKPYVHDYVPEPVVLPILKDVWISTDK